VETVERDKVCAAEIWCECLNGDIKYMKQSDTREINNILDSIEELEKDKNGRLYGREYGLQRGYKVK
jgi:hypothetical protein